MVVTPDSVRKPVHPGGSVNSGAGPPATRAWTSGSYCTPAAGTAHNWAPPSTSVTESAPVMAKLDEMVRTTVTQAIANAMPSTDSTNRSGLRRILASANRTRYPKVFPEALAIDGDLTVVVARDSTARWWDR